MQALEQMLHEKSWGEAFLAYFYPKLGEVYFNIMFSIGERICNVKHWRTNRH
jgi:hypothetical protein